MLILHGYLTFFPALTDLVEHGRDHAHQDVNGFEVRGQGVFDNPLSRSEIIFLTGLEERFEDVFRHGRIPNN
jgi:hypothetical protein